MEEQTPKRDKLLIIGSRPSKALRGDIVRVEYGKSKGILLEVGKVITIPDRNNPKKTIDLIVGMNGIVVPVNACTFYSLRPGKRPEDFKKKRSKGPAC